MKVNKKNIYKLYFISFILVCISLYMIVKTDISYDNSTENGTGVILGIFLVIFLFLFLNLLFIYVFKFLLKNKIEIDINLFFIQKNEFVSNTLRVLAYILIFLIFYIFSYIIKSNFFIYLFVCFSNVFYISILIILFLNIKNQS
ncbi:hypothetical protein TCEA9_22280 [Thermobrachium celere]|nr:hypothetical protein TCEA9_22280 [Thermobrachium celere]